MVLQPLNKEVFYVSFRLLVFFSQHGNVLLIFLYTLSLKIWSLLLSWLQPPGGVWESHTRNSFSLEWRPTVFYLLAASVELSSRGCCSSEATGPWWQFGDDLWLAVTKQQEKHLQRFFKIVYISRCKSSLSVLHIECIFSISAFLQIFRSLDPQILLN